MAGIIDNSSKWVSKNPGGLLKPDAVLLDISNCLLRIPLEMQIHELSPRGPIMPSGDDELSAHNDLPLSRRAFQRSAPAGMLGRLVGRARLRSAPINNHWIVPIVSHIDAAMYVCMTLDTLV